MNFFKSVFADEDSEPDSPKSDSKLSDNHSPSDPNPSSPPPEPNQNPNPIDSTTTTDAAAAAASGGWSFGSLIQTLSTKSESVIEIYRRDLKEFGSGLKKEIEVAHGSLENVSQTIDEISSTVLKGTAQIISQGKEAILAADQDSDSSDNNNNERSLASPQSLNSKPYSRFDTQVRSIQVDASTYCDEPEDLDDYEKWKARFVLDEKRDEIESLLEENGALETIHKRIVPINIDEETFWCRYYYKIYKLKLAEDLRANLVKRAISREEEDLSWDVDDDEQEEEEDQEREHQTMSNLKENVDSVVARDEIENDKSEKIVKSDEQIEDISVEEPKSKDPSMSSSDDKVESEKSKEDTESKPDEKSESGPEGKGDNGESSKDSDVSVISSHPSIPEEEDLGWDEIEDLSSIDERKASHNDSPKIADIRRRLSGAAEEEEDLSWDIEDDDEPVKA